MLNKEWYSKNELLEIYPISISTYKKRIKNLDPTLTKFITSKSGSPSRLIHHSVIDKLFRERRRLSNNESKQTIKWVRNHYWNYFGDIVPGSSNEEDIKHKMRHLFGELKKLHFEKNRLTLFYSIENNTNDKYYHTHFLIDCSKDMIDIKDIERQLELLCDPNSYKESRIYLKKYDTKFGKGGAIYNSKKKSCFYELLI